MATPLFPSHLTLTSVVFELLKSVLGIGHIWYLTLTSVVFESGVVWDVEIDNKFNFNKCCIWIDCLDRYVPQLKKFNFNKCCIWIRNTGCSAFEAFYLTLTSVVFE